MRPGSKRGSSPAVCPQRSPDRTFLSILPLFSGCFYEEHLAGFLLLTTIGKESVGNGLAASHQPLTRSHFD
jgi:hypothetical protein